MIKSYTRTTFKFHKPAVDNTPQQWHIDTVHCVHCREGQEHSEWAHEDAIGEYLDNMEKGEANETHKH